MWGAVPHKALKLNVDQILDSQRRKITYSVTTAKTKDTTFNNPGVLQTRTVNDNPNCEAPPADITVNAVHLTLVSGGEDGAGAYDINGNLFAACNTTGTPTLDSENCDRDTLFVFPKCALNTNSNPRALFYDDLVSNQPWTSVPSRIWDDASDPTNIGSVVGFIGIATGNPEYPVDVAGNIRTSNSATDASKQGNVHASSYCTVNGAECFEPSSIADYDPRMNCDSEKGMSGIGSNQAKCSNIIPNGKKSSCPSGQFATGLTAGGAVICSGS
jgi:hypothetical protein